VVAGDGVLYATGKPSDVLVSNPQATGSALAQDLLYNGPASLSIVCKRDLTCSFGGALPPAAQGGSVNPDDPSGSRWR